MINESKYKTYMKTIPAHVNFDAEIQKGLDTNVFSEVYKLNGEGLYKGPNYFMMVKQNSDDSKEIKIETLGIPKNRRFSLAVNSS